MCKLPIHASDASFTAATLAPCIEYTNEVVSKSSHGNENDARIIWLAGLVTVGNSCRVRIHELTEKGLQDIMFCCRIVMLVASI